MMAKADLVRPSLCLGNAGPDASRRSDELDQPAGPVGFAIDQADPACIAFIQTLSSCHGQTLVLMSC